MTESQTERTRAVIDKLYDAYLTGNTEGMLALMAPNVKVTFNYAGTFAGMAEARPFMTWNGAQLPELQFNVRHKIIDGSRAAVTWDETGTTNPGEPWEAKGVDVYRIADGQVAEITVYSDTEKMTLLLDPWPPE